MILLLWNVWTKCQPYPLLSSAVNSILNTRDFHAVDHRLKLYLDMDIFEENTEEFQFFLKVSSYSTTSTAPWLSLYWHSASSASRACGM